MGTARESIEDRSLPPGRFPPAAQLLVSRIWAMSGVSSPPRPSAYARTGRPSAASISTQQNVKSMLADGLAPLVDTILMLEPHEREICSNINCVQAPVDLFPTAHKGKLFLCAVGRDLGSGSNMSDSIRLMSTTSHQGISLPPLVLRRWRESSW